MSDSIIRLSGTRINDAVSVHNLITHIGNSNSRKLIIVSAIPEILMSIYYAIENVSEIDVDDLMNKLKSICIDKTQHDVHANYISITGQVGAIVKGIQLTGDYSVSLMDQLVSFSEKLSAEVFKTVLFNAGIQSTILLPEEIGLLTTEDYGNSTFLSVDTQYIKELPDGCFLIPGSYGITENGKISRAGKSAADYTAAFLTKELNAEKLELWGIDKAFKRADPSIVPDAEIIKRLTYPEASELAYFDHFSFHPRAVEPLENNHIPILILNTENGTAEADTIINTETYIEEQVVKGVASTDDISLLRLNGPGVGLKPGILARVTTGLHQEGINIRSVITSQISINLILERKAGRKALAIIQQLGFSSVKEISLIEDVSLIGIIGHGMQQNYGVSAKIFGALAHQKMNVLLSGSGASDLVSYLVVKTADKDISVNKIYTAFFKEKQFTVEYNH